MEIRIQYPFFEGEGKEILNQLILTKVQEFARIDSSLFPEDAGLTIDYQAKVTLQNAEMVSIAGNVSCFFKQDALVLILPSVHAAGSDYFAAQINYDDIEAFYLQEQKYWD